MLTISVVMEESEGLVAVAETVLVGKAALKMAACIVNEVLDKHKVFLKGIAFCPRGTIPRSRENKKQREKTRETYKLIDQGLLDGIVFKI